MSDEPEVPEGQDTTDGAESIDEAEPRSMFVPVDEIEIRDAPLREVDVRLLPWGTTIDTMLGPEEFRVGAFDSSDVTGVYMYGAEHEMRMGMGQDGRPVATRVPVGRAIKLWADEIGPVARFKMARTAAGDETLALMADRIISGVSVEFSQVPGGTTIESRRGRRVRVHHRARLTGATPTHRPAYGEQATVLQVRSQAEGATPMVEATAPEAGAVTDTTSADTATIVSAIDRAFAAIEARAAAQDAINAAFMQRFEQAAEQARMQIVLPGGGSADDERPTYSRGDWLKMAVRLMTGEQVPQTEMRSLQDVVTSDNPGVVPPAYLTELIGVIDASRPFLGSTRRLPTPASGMKLTVPVINQRPQVGVQTAEKQDVASRITKIGTTDFDAVTIAGAGDLSIQIIKRSSPDFLTLWSDLLAEAYAIEAEDVSIQALLDAIGGVGGASPLDPENLALGDAYVSSFDAIRRPPDTIWLSTQAVGEFIDAKASTSNQPLYPGLRASATAAGGIEGVISGLRPVHVPTLDAHGAYAIVGPSSGFAWAEDGSYTLQADVPSKAGRDVALVSILWAAPWYPAAFTAYNVAS